MTIEAWLKAAVADAEEHGLPELKPLLEGLAASTSLLRGADFNQRADGIDPGGGLSAAGEASERAAQPAGTPAAPRGGRLPAATPSGAERLGIEDFGRRLRAGSITALAATDACLHRIDE